MSVDPDWLKAQGKDEALLTAAASLLWSRKPADVMGVAVSGGGDSIATLHIYARLASRLDLKVHAVTIDHGLRPEAADEARFVRDFCETLGITHDTLRWDSSAVQGNLQDQARRARYALIDEWSERYDVCDVAVGHTANDEAETFLMRLARASGTEGLSGMRRWFDVGLTRFHRPFLRTSREELREYLNRHELSCVEDPTNDDPAYERVKARQALAALGPLGITVEKLTTVTDHIAAANVVVRGRFNNYVRDVCKISAGDVVLWRKRLFNIEQEVLRRLFVKTLMWVGGTRYPPRSRAIDTLEQAIREQRDTTLNGCRIICDDVSVRVSRELKSAAQNACETTEIWDGRWEMKGPHDKSLQIRALGSEGLRDCPDWRDSGLPRTSLVATPAIWHGEALVAAPVAGLTNGWTARIVADFHDVAFAH